MPIPREVNAGPEGLLYLKPAEEIIAYFSKTDLDLTNKDIYNKVIEVPYVYMLDYQINMDPKSQLTYIVRREI